MNQILKTASLGKYHYKELSKFHQTKVNSELVLGLLTMICTATTAGMD